MAASLCPIGERTVHKSGPFENDRCFVSWDMIVADNVRSCPPVSIYEYTIRGRNVLMQTPPPTWAPKVVWYAEMVGVK